MSRFIFEAARVFDGRNEPADELYDVVVADGMIQEVEVAGKIASSQATRIACEGRTLMPGLIDAHVHVYVASLRPDVLANKPPTYFAHYAAGFFKGSLDRGFTTLRDVGGAEIGVAAALRDGLVSGPRLFYGGRVISQTGGHGDGRSADLDAYSYCGCGGGKTHFMGIVADGADAVRAAVREELRRGAHHNKIVASGGIISPNDAIDGVQYSEDEISVAVEEAERAGVYVAAHCHPARAVRRCVELGVRSIEHGTMIDEETAKFVASKGAFVVPTMATIFALLEEGARMGLAPSSMDKLKQVSDHALRGLEIMHQAGVKMGLGTDLLAEQHVRQSTEFELRARVLNPLDILRSACSVNAELLGQSGKLGCVQPGAHADLLLIDGDPIGDISLLAKPDRMPVIMKEGAFHKLAL